MEFIRKYKIDNWEDKREQLLIGIDMMKDNYECLYADMSHSDYTVEHERVYGQVFTDIVTEHLDSYIADWKCSDWRLGNVWFAEYYEGADFDWHTHEGCNMSGVLQVVLDDKENGTKLLKQQIDLEEGDLVVFPSMMPHKSPMVNDSHKIVLGFNWDMCGSELHTK